MNVYEKLQKVRYEMAKIELPKSGFNKFGNFKYYELQDICPTIDSLFSENKITYVINFYQTEAKLTVINIEQPEETIDFVTPIAWAELKGGQRITNIGATHTFCRRYLFLLALNITEGDVLDSLSPEQREVPEPKVDNEKEDKIAIIKMRAKNNKELIIEAMKNAKVSKLEDLSVGVLDELVKALK